MDTAYFIFRTINIVLSAFALIVIGSGWRTWVRQDRLIKFYGLGLTGLLVSSLYGSVESLWTGNPGAYRTIGYTVPLVWLTYSSVAMLRKHYRVRRSTAASTTRRRNSRRGSNRSASSTTKPTTDDPRPR